MGQVSRVLRNFVDTHKGRSGFGWWCPGCKHMHYVGTDGAGSPNWGFDGNLEAPTFTPSFREFIPAMPDHPRPECRVERTTCHVFVQNGMINFLDDCAHDLRGLHPMVDLSTITGYSFGYD